MMEDEKARVADTSGRSSSPSGMESSVLRFKNVNFVVPNRKGDDKFILQNVSATVKWGHVLAILGPSGAGKTTLINALTLDAFYGNPYGSVTLNDTPLTDRIFKNHCYVVVQHDKHWPYLTCRETLLYAAELYGVGGGGGAVDGNTSRIRKTSKTDLTRAVDAIVEKMGLSICADTRNARLSGGQARRLSIGMALLKRPTLLFLDEPTSGLDAAAADQIMKEIVNVAKNENLIIVCTIHQPSTKVFEGFDQVMVMSKGREAFTGDVSDASPYFESIGHSLPVQTNPAEHFLDLVNADFSDDAEVERILNTWEEYKSGGSSSHHHRKSLEDSVGQSGVANKNTSKISEEISIIFRRHLSLIIRDPILYVGRAIVFLVANTVFALVYLKARSYDQDQALNKMWVNIWHVGVPTNMGVVAVYALNDEFKTIMRESKNGMVSPLTYALAKSIMVIPIIFVFAIFALAIPSTLIMDFPAESFGKAVLLWGCLIYVFECVAECLSVWCDDPIIGMLQFMNFWFASFLFGGFLIPLRDMFWPFKLFYYLMPYGYYIRSQMFNLLSSTTWTPCDPNNNVNRSSICVAPPAGANILRSIHRAYPIVDDRDTYVQDIFILIAIAFVYKVVYLAGVYQKGAKAAHIRSNRDYQSSSKVRPSGQASTTEKQASAVSIVEKMRQPLPPVEVRRVNL